MISDMEIPGADPAEVIKQYKRYVYKLAWRYIPILKRSGAVDLDDLCQVGFLAIMDAQKCYNPERGPFIRLLFFYVRKYMRDALGINPNTGAAPEQLAYLDAPLSDDEEGTLLDVVADPDVIPVDEPIIENETRYETAEEIRAALDRMKSDKQRRAVSLVWLEGKSRKDAAEKMKIPIGTFHTMEQSARANLRRDWRLKRFARDETPIFHVGLKEFNNTWTSAVEKSVIWREKHVFSKTAEIQQD